MPRNWRLWAYVVLLIELKIARPKSGRSLQEQRHQWVTVLWRPLHPVHGERSRWTVHL